VTTALAASVSAPRPRHRLSRIKQYHKEGQALRAETTINDTRDFAIGRRIENLEDLRKIGFAANRRLLDVLRIGHDCFIGEASFQNLRRPVTIDNQRASALRFADPRVQALCHVMLLFLLVHGTFADLAASIALSSDSLMLPSPPRARSLSRCRRRCF